MRDHLLCHHPVEGEKITELDGLPVVKMSRRDLVRAVAMGGALAVVPAGLSGCTTNPETGKSQFILVSEAQMASMAQSSWTDLKKSEPTLTGTAYNRRLEKIGARIKKASGRADQSWEFVVFDSEAKNAFVLPGNRVGFYKGMMDFTENDDQLAAIMGHEVGHVSGRHAAARFSQQTSSQLAIMGVSSLSTRTAMDARQAEYIQKALGLGLTYGVLLPFSRRHELEADILGANYMHKAGYDSTQAVRLWERMAQEGRNQGPSWLSTHPDPAYRAENLQQYIARQGWS